MLSMLDCSPPPPMMQGLSSMGQPYLTDEQFSLLCRQYSDPKRKDYVCWKKFLQDVDQGEFDSMLSTFSLYQAYAQCGNNCHDCIPVL